MQPRLFTKQHAVEKTSEVRKIKYAINFDADHDELQKCDGLLSKYDPELLQKHLQNIIERLNEYIRLVSEEIASDIIFKDDALQTISHYLQFGLLLSKLIKATPAADKTVDSIVFNQLIIFFRLIIFFLDEALKKTVWNEKNGARQKDGVVEKEVRQQLIQFQFGYFRLIFDELSHDVEELRDNLRRLFNDSIAKEMKLHLSMMKKHVMKLQSCQQFDAYVLHYKIINANFLLHARRTQAALAEFALAEQQYPLVKDNNFMLDIFWYLAQFCLEFIKRTFTDPDINSVFAEMQWMEKALKWMSPNEPGYAILEKEINTSKKYLANNNIITFKSTPAAGHPSHLFKAPPKENHSKSMAKHQNKKRNDHADAPEKPGRR